MKCDSAVLVLAVAAAVAALPTLSPKLSPAVQAFKGRRKLVDGYQFRNENFYDPRTGDMRNFLEELRSSSPTSSPSLSLKTFVDADNTQTSGNGETLGDLNDLLPPFNAPVLNEELFRVARDYQLTLKRRLQMINLDVFSEDPNTFLGDRNSYYLIINKRGLIFYYLSRVVLYGLVVYLMVQFIFRDFHKAKLDLNEEDVPRRARILSKAQLGVLVATLGCSVGLLVFLEWPKGEISKVFSELFFTFKQMSIQVSQIIKRNKALNGMKLQVPGGQKAYFTIQDRLGNSEAVAQADLQKVGTFLDASRLLRQVSKNVPAIAFTIVSFFMVGLYTLGKKSKSANVQLGLLVISAGSLAFLFTVLDRFVVGFSGMNDLCLGILRHAKNPVLPHQGLGVANFLGCSMEDDVFQQLYVNSLAQNAAMTIYNAELRALGREPVASPRQAIKNTAYLRSLDSSTETLENYSKVLDKNAKILSDLLGLSGCNGVRKWIDTTQGELCLTASRHVMATLWVYLALGVLLFASTALSMSLMWWFVQLAKKKQADNFLLHADQFDNKFITE